MAKKVGDLKKTEVEVKEKGRTDYDNAALIAANPEAVNADGLLTIAPTDYNYRKTNPMKKEQFLSESVYLRYQALVAQQKAEFFAQKSFELVGKADRLEKFGSESTRKAATKLARAKQQMTVLRQQLLDSGMSETELDSLIQNM